MALSTSLNDMSSGRINGRPQLRLRLHGRDAPTLPLAMMMLIGFGILVAGCLAGAVAGLVMLLQRW